MSLYVKRGAAYRVLGDIKMAVIDYQSARQPLHLNVTDTTAILRDGEKVTATLQKGQSLSITKVERLGNLDWLWVSSVNGNDAARGWILMTAVEPKLPTAESFSAITASDASNHEDRRKTETPVIRAAERRSDILNNLNDRYPNPLLQRQIDLQEHRMNRMPRSRR